MEFSEQQGFYGNAFQWSKDGQQLVFCSTSNRQTYQIFDKQFAHLLHEILLPSPAQWLEWSPDSSMILFGILNKANVVMNILVYSTKNGKFVCKLEEPLPILKAIWAPDGMHILTFSDFKLRILVWSLETKKSIQIANPKDHTSKCVAFSKDGKFVAIAERREAKDFINLFSCVKWTLLKQVAMDTTDLFGIEWSPNSHYICAWDSIVECKLQILNVAGHILKTVSFYNDFLGIKAVRWSHDSRLLAVSTHDEVVRILDHINWNPVITLSHPSKVDIPDLPLYVETEVVEEEKSESDKFWKKVTTKSFSTYQVHYQPVILPVTPIDEQKPNPPLGVSLMDFSPDSKYFFTRNDNLPTVLWIWNIVTQKQIGLIAQKQAIKNARWQPQPAVTERKFEKSTEREEAEREISPILVFASGIHSIFTWSLAGCGCIEMPFPGFMAHNLLWNPSGDSVTILDKESFCVGFVTSHDDKENMPDFDNENLTF
jgi:WD40 repeat protein